MIIIVTAIIITIPIPPLQSINIKNKKKKTRPRIQARKAPKKRFCTSVLIQYLLAHLDSEPLQDAD